MKAKSEMPPCRLGEREGESKLTTHTVTAYQTRSKPLEPIDPIVPINPIERKLSRALGVLLDVIDRYRESSR